MCAALKVTVTSRSACADETRVDGQLACLVKQHSDKCNSSASLYVTAADAAMERNQVPGMTLHACMTHAAQQLFLKRCLARYMRSADWIWTAALLRRAHVALQECCTSLVARL